MHQEWWRGPSSVGEKQTCSELKGRLCISHPEKRSSYRNEKGTQELPCAWPHAGSLLTTHPLGWHVSTLQFHLLSCMECSGKLKPCQNTHSLKTDIFAFGTTCYILKINGCKTSNTSLPRQIFVITDAAQPCSGTSSSSAGSRPDDPIKAPAAKSGESPAGGITAGQRRKRGETSGLKIRMQTEPHESTRERGFPLGRKEKQEPIHFFEKSESGKQSTLSLFSFCLNNNLF